MGVALKTAKGHSLCVVSAAWALQRTLSLAFQDLTNPGIAAIHAALFAARLPTINGAELNSPQFTPEAKAAWLPRLSGLFVPREGVHLVPGGTAGRPWVGRMTGMAAARNVAIAAGEVSR